MTVAVTVVVVVTVSLVVAVAVASGVGHSRMLSHLDPRFQQILVERVPCGTKRYRFADGRARHDIVLQWVQTMGWLQPTKSLNNSVGLFHNEKQAQL